MGRKSKRKIRGLGKVLTLPNLAQRFQTRLSGCEVGESVPERLGCKIGTKALESLIRHSLTRGEKINERKLDRLQAKAESICRARAWTEMKQGAITKAQFKDTIKWCKAGADWLSEDLVIEVLEK